MTRNNDTGLRLGDWNEHNAKALARTHWRASLVPAAAVIPTTSFLTATTLIYAIGGITAAAGTRLALQ